MKFFILISVVLAAATFARAEIKTEAVDYKQGDTSLKGYLAYDDALQGQRPGVVIYPEWWGLTDYPKHRAEQLAKLGYIAFAADLYGDGKTTDDPKEATALSGELYKNPRVLRDRAGAALDTLRKQKGVDPSKVAAIGYCFGGTTALELARDGGDVACVVTFHAGLDPLAAAEDKTAPIKPKILVCTGADDAFVPPEKVTAFEKEMDVRKADWELNVYAHAVHAFTNPDAGKYGMKNIAYNAEADRRSWKAMEDFFAETIGTGEKAETGKRADSTRIGAPSKGTMWAARD